MIDGRNLVDVQVRAAGLPARQVEAHLAAEGVDLAVVAGCTPGYTPHSPGRIRLALSITHCLPHLAVEELLRQTELGTVACILDPKRAAVALDNEWFYSAYAACQSVGVPIVVDCGARSYPGANPTLLGGVLQDFPELDIVLASGGRGWRDEAAAVALACDRVWIELSGLFIPKLRDCYAGHDWTRLLRRMIFGSGWPVVTGIAHHARAVAAQCPDEKTADLVLGGNAAQVYRLSLEQVGAADDNTC